MKLIDDLKQFYGDTTTEFKKISWPTRDEVKDSTMIVCTAILFVMVVLGAYDLGITAIYNAAQKLFSK